MENAIHSLTLDLTGPDIRPVVEVRKDNARTLVIALTQGGRPYWIAEGVTAVFSARKPDGNPLFNACTIEKKRVRYDFTAQTTNVAGIVECEILLYSGDEKILSSPKFELLVDDIIHQEGDVPESAPEISALTQMVAAGTAMLEDLRETLEGLEGVEEILTQARAALEDAEAAASHAADSKAAAENAAADALGYAEDAEAHATAARKSDDNSRMNLHEAEVAAQNAEAAAKRAEEAAAGVGQGGGGLTVTDDGNGNIAITGGGTSGLTDDGNGNLTFM